MYSPPASRMLFPIISRNCNNNLKNEIHLNFLSIFESQLIKKFHINWWYILIFIESRLRIKKKRIQLLSQKGEAFSKWSIIMVVVVVGRGFDIYNCMVGVDYWLLVIANNTSIKWDCGQYDGDEFIYMLVSYQRRIRIREPFSWNPIQKYVLIALLVLVEKWTT